MGLDIRKPIGLLFAVIAAELIVNEGIQLAGGSAGASVINTWCALGLGLFGFLFLWLSRRRGDPRKAGPGR